LGRNQERKSISIIQGVGLLGLVALLVILLSGDIQQKLTTVFFHKEIGGDFLEPHVRGFLSTLTVLLGGVAIKTSALHPHQRSLLLFDRIHQLWRVIHRRVDAMMKLGYQTISNGEAIYLRGNALFGRLRNKLQKVRTYPISSEGVIYLMVALSWILAEVIGG
jgi:hypothetical protein